MKAEDHGLRISGLKRGVHLRVYGINGVQIYSNKNVSEEVFVPLKPGVVYMISDGTDVLKYAL